MTLLLLLAYNQQSCTDFCYFIKFNLMLIVALASDSVNFYVINDFFTWTVCASTFKSVTKKN